jgi:hypothetical protein
MIRQEITVKDFNKIAKENEYFLWHFLQKEQENNALIMWSIFKEKNDTIKKRPENEMKLVLDKIDIPYYESYTEDSIDFLMDMGVNSEKLWEPKKYKNLHIDKNRYFSPIVIGFKRNKIITSTFEQGNCYCHQGIIELIGKLNPEFLLNSKLD